MKKDKSLLIAYIVLFTVSLFVGIFSWWQKGLVPEGRNFPNPVVLSMFLLNISNGLGIYFSYKKLERLNSDKGSNS